MMVMTAVEGIVLMCYKKNTKCTHYN